MRVRGGEKKRRGTGPLVSIITVVRNNASGLGATVSAVLEQTYPDIEYFVIDGGSTDGTVDVLRRFDDRIDYWLSERDTGLYDAMNKGIALVRDRDAYILFANSGDMLASPDAVESLVSESHGKDFVYAQERLTDGEIAAVVGHEVSLGTLATDNICHAAAMVRKSVFDTVGSFDLRYRIVADYDFFVRCFAHPVETRFVKRVIAEVGMFGLSETNFMMLFRERLDVLRRHYRGFSRMRAVARIYCLGIPRHFFRARLRRLGLLSFWRAVKAT